VQKRHGKVRTCPNVSSPTLYDLHYYHNLAGANFYPYPIRHTLFHFTQPHHHANNILPHHQIKLPARPHLRLPQVSPIQLHPPIVCEWYQRPNCTPHSHRSPLELATITHTWHIYAVYHGSHHRTANMVGELSL